MGIQRSKRRQQGNIALRFFVNACTGTVKWFDEAKGFGFIAPEDGSSDVFVHYSVIEGKGFRTLAENQKVEFDVKAGPKGPQATMVKKLAVK